VGKATGIMELLRQQRYAFAREAYRAMITRGIEACLQATEWRVVFAAGGLIASHSNTENNADLNTLARVSGPERGGHEPDRHLSRRPGHPRLPPAGAESGVHQLARRQRP
jgi:hypothetical protein